MASTSAKCDLQSTRLLTVPTIRNPTSFFTHATEDITSTQLLQAAKHVFETMTGGSGVTLPHVLRTVTYAPYVVKAYNKFHERTMMYAEYKRLMSLVPTIQLILMFEASSGDDKSTVAKAFKSYISENGIKLNPHFDRYSDTVDKIVHACMALDNMHKLNKFEYDAVCDALIPDFGAKNVKSLKDLVLMSDMGTGDKILGVYHPQDYDAHRFEETSQSVERCITYLVQAIECWKFNNGSFEV